MKPLPPGQRLKLAISESGLSQRRVAIAVGRAPQSITNAIRRDRVSADLARAVASITGHRWEWLFSGDEPARNETGGTLRAISQALRRIPVISLDLAAGWPRSVREAGNMGEVTVDKELAEGLGDSAFCVVIEDDSMRDASSESVQRGDKVIIDPSITPRPGDLVVATIAGHPSALFRKYRERGQDGLGKTQVELVPLNPDYASATGTISDDTKIIGVMIEHRRVRRASR